MSRSISRSRLWMLIWGLGLAGQLCWNIENQWFNTFVYAKIAKDSTIVTLMVITSALVTTFSTFFFGTLSDRRGTRRRYIAIGYIFWGIFTIAFGMTEFINSGTVAKGVELGTFAAVLVVLADDVMSFFGSMGNDSGFNAWINDITTDSNRGQLGAALATQPVIGTIVGTVLGGMLIGPEDNYQRLFWAMGIFVIAMGILSLFTMKDAPSLKPHKEGKFWDQFLSVFSFKGFFSRRELVLVSITTALFFIPFNIYFVHMGNWLIYRIGFTPDSMGLIEGVGLIAAMALVIPAIGLINRNKTPLVAGIAIIIDMIGLWVIYLFVRPGMVDIENVFSTKNIVLFLGVFLAGGGYVLIAQCMTMWVKQLYPEQNRGQFEGVRITFFTLIPMIIGTVIGNIIIKTGSGTFLNEFGIMENIPTEAIYLWAAILLVPAFIPLGFASRDYHRRVEENAAVKAI
ncbi:MAG TPA: MFS transporter [Rectinema sp.]|nr:MFS transporter [Rectinema sp.]HQL16284.1 MFS transporter [Rectinema sp.]